MCGNFQVEVWLADLIVMRHTCLLPSQDKKEGWSLTVHHIGSDRREPLRWHAAYVVSLDRACKSNVKLPGCSCDNNHQPNPQHRLFPTPYSSSGCMTELCCSPLHHYHNIIISNSIIVSIVQVELYCTVQQYFHCRAL